MKLERATVAAVALYRSVLEEIRGRIVRGELKPGDRIESVAEIQRVYRVSAITALRVLEELQKAGLANKIQGRGTFVNGVAAGVERENRPATDKIREVICLLPPQMLEKSDFYSRILDGAMARLETLGVGCVIEKLAPQIFQDGIIRLPFEPRPGAGAIVFQRDRVAVIAQLLAARAPVVIADCFVHGVNASLSDNAGGVAALTRSFYERGHRRLLFVDYPYGNSTNEHEREDAFLRETAQLGISTETISWQEPEALADRVLAAGCSGVLFSTDITALKFMDAARARGVRFPEDLSVSGFDDYATKRSPEAEGLTTVRVDCRLMGEKAVDVLFEAAERPPEKRVGVVERIPGQLIERASIGSPHQNLIIKKRRGK